MVLYLAVCKDSRKGNVKIYSVLGFQCLSAVAKVYLGPTIVISALFQAGDVTKRTIIKPPKCEVIPEERDSEDSKDLVRDKDSAPLLMSSPIPVEIPVPEPPVRKTSRHWVRKSE